jgi:hypothetical protein
VYQADSGASSEKKNQMQIELLSHHTPLDMGGQDQVSEHKEFSFLEINRVPSPVNGQNLSGGKSSFEYGSRQGFGGAGTVGNSLIYPAEGAVQLHGRNLSSDISTSENNMAVVSASNHQQNGFSRFSAAHVQEKNSKLPQ